MVKANERWAAVKAVNSVLNDVYCEYFEDTNELDDKEKEMAEKILKARTLIWDVMSFYQYKRDV